MFTANANASTHRL